MTMLTAYHEKLIDTYGPLMTIETLAQALQKTPSGLRQMLSSDKSETTAAIRESKVRFGRRVLFKTHLIAKIIDEG